MKAAGLLIGSIMFSTVPSLRAQEDSSRTDCTPMLLFTSDTQEPMGVEKIWLGSQQNERATTALFKDLLEQEPTDLFLLGDLVNLGFKASRWNTIDPMLALAKERGFDVHAILGNHELMGRAAMGERNFQSRFPAHVRTGYSVRRGPILVVLLNSNFSKLSKAEFATQVNWYERTLREADANGDIRTVIVCCHHSPYSDSKLVGSNSAVQQLFVAPFRKAHKTSVFISGHAHIFQHFQQEGKHFFVIGGGGGLHHPLSKRVGAEVCLEPDYDPLFHYLSVQLCDSTLFLVSHRLKDDFAGFDIGCDYTIDVSAPVPRE